MIKPTGKMKKNVPASRVDSKAGITLDIRLRMFALKMVECNYGVDTKRADEVYRYIRYGEVN